MDVRIGPYALAFVEKTDSLRVKLGNRRSTESSKQGRIDKKKEVQERLAQYDELDGQQYGPGIDS